MSDVTESNPMKDAIERGMSKTLPFVSVILPVYNDAEALRLCLRSLRAQTYPADRFEVIVVDNGSTKDNPQAVVAEFPGYQCTLETKVGSYAARNKGISIANGEVYAFIDSDCIASEQWLEEGVRTLLANPECGLVGGHVEVFVQDPERPTSVELHERVSAFECKKYIEQWHVCVTANMFVWRKVFDSVGLFNESFKSGGDWEWSTRVHMAGLELIYNDKLRIQHPARRTWCQIIKAKRRVVGGKFALERQRNDSKLNHLTNIFHNIYHACVPRISRIRYYCTEDRFKNRSERFRVVMVYVVLHYVQVWERLRLMLGSNASRD